MPKKTRIKNFIAKEKRDLEMFELSPESFKVSGEWPLTVKVSLPIILAIAITFLSFYIYFNKKDVYLDGLKKKETQMTEEVMMKIDMTAGIEDYEKQIKTMNNSFKSLLSKLPTNIEMDGLLSDISQNEKNNGVVFKNIQMLQEVKTEFYIEHPIEIIATGSYHQIANFISDISNLGRIVTFHNFEMTNDKNGTGLEVRIIAKTYKYETRQEEQTNNE